MAMMTRIKGKVNKDVQLFCSYETILGKHLNNMLIDESHFTHTSQSAQAKQEESDHEHFEDESKLDDYDGNESDSLISEKSFPQIEDNLETGKNTTMKDTIVEANVVEFNWIAQTEKGSRFLEKLCETSDLEYFNIDVVKSIVMFQWKYYMPKLMMTLFMPMAVSFLLFVLYVTWIFDQKIDENEKWGSWDTADFIIAIIIIVFQVFFLYVELRQFLFYKLDYFKSPWNLIDITSITLNLTVAIMDLADEDMESVNCVASVAVLIMHIRIFSFLESFKKTASIVNMIKATVIDMVFFAIVLFNAVIATGNAAYILGFNSKPEDGNFAGDTTWEAFLFAYRLGLGDFATDGFGTRNEAVIWICWFANTLVVLITLLNLLIAIMGDTYERLSENIECIVLKVFASIIKENEFLFNRKKIMAGKNKSVYIVMVSPENTEGSIDQWKGRINLIKKIIDKNLSKHGAKLLHAEKKLEKTFELELKNRLRPAEVKFNKKMASLKQRMLNLRKAMEAYKPDNE